MQEATRYHVAAVRDQRRVDRSKLSLDAALAELIEEFKQRHHGLAFHRVVAGHADKNTRLQL